MQENLDLDVSKMIDGVQTIESAAQTILQEIGAVGNGRETAAEKLGFQEMAIYRNNEILGCDE